MKRVIVCMLLLCVLCSCADAAVVDGQVRLGILTFKTKAEGISEAQAAAIGDIFTRMLTGSKTITVVEREQIAAVDDEQKMSMEGLITDDTASRLGKRIGCNYMLIGAVTGYEQSSKETDLWLVRQVKYYATVTIDARIINVDTTKVVLSLSETGTTTHKGEEVNLPHIGINSKEGLREKMILQGIAGGAINEAISHLAFKLRENLTGEYIEVVKLGSPEISIGLGERNGALNGGFYRVYAQGREIYDAEGKSLGHEIHDLAVVKITNVQDEFSNAVLAAKSAGNLALIRKGDKVSPVTQDEMQTMIKNKVFIKSRPKSSPQNSEREKLRRRSK